MIGELIALVVGSGDTKARGTLSSGASRLVVSLIVGGVGEGSRFSAFRLYFSLRLVGPSLFGAANLGAGDL